ncbi:longin domain-containing protein [Cavenderia fasciculata]|uniref:Longin domain-containing protein n=1 Tax=Cavenderia fasciculata TaxID=261658 RepID=F4Q3F3_CACFS|nr:longin domain-containing protein [Cavenderia fasciculata]EGG16822.1 longin domain-containing protein [Cavenderia fasciculata]|eukprot:XP_004355296.1 longin domain-containing protein [Cavenderia fasciculata]
MYVYSISVFKVVRGSKPVLLTIVYEVSSFGFFQRGSVKEVALFVLRETVERTNIGERVSMEHEQSKKVCHATADSKGLACAVLTDSEYPGVVAHKLVRLVLEQFHQTFSESSWKSISADTELQLPSLPQLIATYQDPHKADPMLGLQKNLEETITIVKKTVQQLGERGEKLEDIAMKSDDLSFQSKAFMQNAERMNKCCGYL